MASVTRESKIKRLQVKVTVSPFRIFDNCTRIANWLPHKLQTWWSFRSETLNINVKRSNG